MENKKPEKIGGGKSTSYLIFVTKKIQDIAALGPQGEIFPVAILRKMCLSPEYISFDIGIEGCTDLCQVLVLVRRSVDTAQRIQ